jgi:hypothetical protein
MQVVSPDWFTKEPMGHRVQLVEPGDVEMEPAEQSVHVWFDVAAREVENEPAAQDRQVCGWISPVPVEKVPAGHRSHSEARVVLPYSPGEQRVHALTPVAFETVPSEQFSHLVAPVRL